MRQLEDRLHSSAGFTLVELIVVMAIIGILATIAIPSFRGFTDGSNVTAAVNDLVSAFNLARSEAVTRSTNVSVCKSANQTACVTTGNWDQGWIVFTDANADGTVNGTDAVLRVYAKPSGNTTMTAAGNLVNRVTYASTGFFSGVFNGTVTVTSGSRSEQVIANNTGRFRTL